MTNTDNGWDNSELAARRKERIERLGGFRTLIKQKSTLTRRVFNPTRSQKVHVAKEVVGATVIDAEGEKYPTKEVLPASTDSVVTNLKAGGSAQILPSGGLSSTSTRRALWITSQPR